MLGILYLALQTLCQRVLSTKPEVEVPKDLLTSQATSPIEVVTQVVPTTGLVVKLAGPLIPSDQAEGERQYVLVVSASVRRLNLEATTVIHGDMDNCEFKFKHVDEFVLIFGGGVSWNRLVGWLL